MGRCPKPQSLFVKSDAKTFGRNCVSLGVGDKTFTTKMRFIASVKFICVGNDAFIVPVNCNLAVSLN